MVECKDLRAQKLLNCRNIKKKSCVCVCIKVTKFHKKKVKIGQKRKISADSEPQINFSFLH